MTPKDNHLPITPASNPNNRKPVVCVLASGSKGNTTYLSDGNTHILLDSGLSGIQIERRLHSRGLRAENLDAILISHEHSDHIQGAGVLSRRYQLPVYITAKTAKRSAKRLGRLFETTHFSCGTPFNINSITVHPFSICHDATDPAGFTFQLNGKKVGVATDLGIATHVVKSHLAQCHVLILEANHDPDMLKNGPYTWPLKQRIMSRLGHLSNQDAGKLLRMLLHDQLQQVVLAHLSEINNTPEKAMEAIEPIVMNKDIILSVASQEKGDQPIGL